MTVSSHIMAGSVQTFSALKPLQVPLRVLGAVLVLVLTLAAGTVHAQNDGAYRLGPGDKMRVRVVLWDETALQFIRWDAVSDDYTVQSDGTVLMPLIGSMAATDMTVVDVAETIADQLKFRVGSVEPPSVAVEILEYRPFYVLGDVQNSGAYPAQPGLSVMQAFAIAGGQRVIFDGAQSPENALRDSGSLAQVRDEIARALVRSVRLEAEISGVDELVFPDGLSHPDGPAVLADLMDEERAVFDTRRSAMALEISNLEELKVLLSTEIETLQAKLEGLLSQVALARDNVENMETLLNSGLARAVQIRDSQRALFELESQELDLQTGIFRSQQRVKEADRDIVALRTRRATEATQDLQQVNAALEELATRRAMLREILETTGMVSTGLGDEMVTLFYLTRVGTPGEQQVNGSLMLRPGDVLRVERAAISPAQ